MSDIPRKLGSPQYRSHSARRVATATPKGLKLSSRGQGHGFCARRPRMRPPIHLADPEGVEPFGPFRAGSIFNAPFPWVSPTAIHVAPLRGARPFRMARVEPAHYVNPSHLLNGFALTIVPPSSML